MIRLAVVRRLVGALCLLGLVATSPAAGQTFGRIADTQAQVPGFFYFARTGEPVVAVTAVGLVPSGRYYLGVGATVGDFLALAGGPTAEPMGEDLTVRLYRAGETVYETGLRGVFGPGANPPVLQDGDVIDVTGLITSVQGFFVHNRPGVAPIVVTASGAIGAAGRYVLDEGTTVGDLVAFAGGLAGNARDVNLDITATVRVYREGTVSFESPLVNLYARPTPVLMSGDVVDLDIVTERQTASFTWRDGLSLLTTALSVVILVERFAN